MTMPDVRVAGKRGMLGFPRDRITLKLGAFLVQPKLPSIPDAFGHFTNRGPCTGVLGNNDRACCVLSGAGHEDQLVHYASGRTIPRYTDAVIFEQYEMLSEKDSNGKPKDEGLDPEKVARWRVEHGLKDADGGIHRIKAFALIDSLSELAQATFMFGCAGVGLYLPSSAEKQFAQGHIWDDISEPPDEARGHYVVCIGRNSKKLFVFSTWGDIQAATDAYLHRYMVGGMAMIHPEYITAKGVSPEGLDTAALDAAIKSIPWMRHYMG